MHNGLKNVHSLLFGECLPGRCLATPEGWGRSRGQNWPTHVPGLELGAPGEHWETPEISENLAIPPSKCNQVHHASKLEVETFLFLVPFYQKMLVFPFKIPTPFSCLKQQTEKCCCRFVRFCSKFQQPQAPPMKPKLEQRVADFFWRV